MLITDEQPPSYSVWRYRQQRACLRCRRWWVCRKLRAGFSVCEEPQSCWLHPPRLPLQAEENTEWMGGILMIFWTIFNLPHLYLILKTTCMDPKQSDPQRVKLFLSPLPMLWLSSSWSMKTWSRTKLSSSFCRVPSGLKTSGWRPSLPPEVSWWLKIISRSQRSMNAWTRGTNENLWKCYNKQTEDWFLEMTENMLILSKINIHFRWFIKNIST